MRRAHGRVRSGRSERLAQGAWARGGSRLLGVGLDDPEDNREEGADDVHRAEDVDERLVAGRDLLRARGRTELEHRAPKLGKRAVPLRPGERLPHTSVPT